MKLERVCHKLLQCLLLCSLHVFHCRQALRQPFAVNHLAAERRQNCLQGTADFGHDKQHVLHLLQAFWQMTR